MGCRDEGGSSEFWEECEKCPTVRQNTRSTPADETKHGERTHAGAGLKNVVGLRVCDCVWVFVLLSWGSRGHVLLFLV